MTISVEQPPHRLDAEHSLLFTSGALSFVEDLITEFDSRVEKILLERDRRRLTINEGKWTPAFRNETNSQQWNIAPLPKRLQNRKIDLGDVSPASTAYFVDTLYADVQGIQVQKRFAFFFLISSKSWNEFFDFRWTLTTVFVPPGGILCWAYTM